MKHALLVLLVVALIFAGFWWLQPGSQSSPAEMDESEIGQVTVRDENETESRTEARYEAVSGDVVYHNTVSGYVAEPAEPGTYPGLILIHEWWGLNDNIRELAEDFAEQGYVALAVDLYGGEVADDPKRAGELADAVQSDVDVAFANLEAAVSYLQSKENVAEEELASVGWCFGGGWAYEMAKNDLGIDASVMYYGRFSPEDDLSMMRADILGHFGEEDRSIAVDDVEQFEAKLNTLEGDHAVFIYPNAGHAFANEDNDEAYNEEAAELAWQRTMEFLSRELESDGQVDE